MVVNKETTKSTIMKIKNFILMAIAVVMAFSTSAVKANVSNNTKAEFHNQLHPRYGKIAKWKAKQVKRQMIKRDLKKRSLRSRRRGITIVI
jgi:hypothetical protein